MAKRKTSILDEVKANPAKRFADKLKGSALNDWNDLVQALKSDQLISVAAGYRAFLKRNPTISVSESHFHKELKCAAK